MTLINIDGGQTMHHSKHQTGRAGHKDPVCGMQISQKTAVEEYTYEGKTYYLMSSLVVLHPAIFGPLFSELAF
jgi:hypothetical protein